MNDQSGIQEPPMVGVGGIEEVVPGVHVIPDERIEFVPNVGIVEGTRAVLVIDTAIGQVNGQAILDAAIRIAGHRKLFLTTTHFHPEHAFGSKPFESKAAYVTNASQARELAEKGTEYVEMFSGFGPGLAELLGTVELISPDVTYEGELRIDLGGRIVELLDAGPAHTRGDQLVWLPQERIVFTGDLAENAFFPIFPDSDASGVRWLQALERVVALRPIHVVGGHGAIGGPELIVSVREYLEQVKRLTTELQTAGGEQGEIVATIEAEVLASYEPWGNRDWIKSAVESFQSQLPGLPPR